MKNIIKTNILLVFVLSSINLLAQSKIEKTNNTLLIENKQPLLDGKHQTKAFFSTSNDLTTTKNMVTEFTLDDVNKLYINTVFEDEFQNYFINLASTSNIPFKTFHKYEGGEKKVKIFDNMRMKYELLIDGKVQFSDTKMADSRDNLLIESSNGKIYEHLLEGWFRSHQEFFMKDCKIQCVITYFLDLKNVGTWDDSQFKSKKEIEFFKDKTTIVVKTDVLDYKYDETKATNFFLKVLASQFKYYDLEDENKSLVEKAFSIYKKNKRIKNENIEEVSSIMTQWTKEWYTHVDAVKGRRANVLVFFKDKNTENYRCLVYTLYQEKLYDDTYGEVNVSYATEKFDGALTFMNLYKKQIGLYLKSNTLDSVLD